MLFQDDTGMLLRDKTYCFKKILANPGIFFTELFCNECKPTRRKMFAHRGGHKKSTDQGSVLFLCIML